MSDLMAEGITSKQYGHMFLIRLEHGPFIAQPLTPNTQSYLPLKCCIDFDFLSVVEDLYKSREPVPEMKAIYFMSPTSKVTFYNF